MGESGSVLDFAKAGSSPPVTDHVAMRTPARSSELKGQLLRLTCSRCCIFAGYSASQVHHATRAFPPGHDDVPSAHRAVGQAVLVPGDMGTCSYVCAGTGEAMTHTFGSTCHGAGRVMSRS